MSLERTWRDQLYQEFARIGKSLSSPKRLELLDLLSQGPKSVDALSKTTGMSVANVSQHLQTLHESRLVRYTKKGTYVIYELADPAVSDFLLSMYNLSEKQLIEIQRIKDAFLNYPTYVEPISLDELKERMERGDVVLVDVRPKEEYDAGHIPGAVSIPFEELDQHLSTLPTNKDIVAYCRGPYCLLSAEAAEILKTKGLLARRLKEGLQEWRQYSLHLQ